MAAPVTIRKRGFLGATRLIKGVVKYSGLGTFYEPGSGSCGEYNVDKDSVVAVNKAQMQNGANPNNNPHCGNMVSIEGTVGKTLARIEDTCPSCAEGALDMSPTVFEKVCGSLSIGVCSINWYFV